MRTAHSAQLPTAATPSERAASSSASKSRPAGSGLFRLEGEKRPDPSFARVRGSAGLPILLSHRIEWDFMVIKNVCQLTVAD